MKLFTVAVNKDDTVRVLERAVTKTTPLFYYIADPTNEMPWDEEYAFGYRSRIPKEDAHTSAREALQHYMERRQTDKQNALSVAGQATKQIASANELLMKEPAIEQQQAQTPAPQPIPVEV